MGNRTTECCAVMVLPRLRRYADTEHVRSPSAWLSRSTSGANSQLQHTRLVFSAFFRAFSREDEDNTPIPTG